MMPRLCELAPAPADAVRWPHCNDSAGHERRQEWPRLLGSAGDAVRRGRFQRRRAEVWGLTGEDKSD
jgi:hypothetical protein